MATHGYYSTAHWKALRRAALERDGYRCTVPGCVAPAGPVDHIVTRPRVPYATPADRLDNLRSLCPAHDAQVKEHKHGPPNAPNGGVTRRHGGRPFVKGCGADGWPLSQR